MVVAGPLDRSGWAQAVVEPRPVIVCANPPPAAAGLEKAQARAAADRSASAQARNRIRHRRQGAKRVGRSGKRGLTQPPARVPSH